MPTCPVCQAARVIIVIGDSRRGLCSSCGARWIQDGAVQRRIEVPEAARPGGA
ncbi:MAG TPA: hypothetical protein VHL78_01715 [Actinomycetota bacterium]|nr:hypothetical protein [Actinomycetota bacterium]